MDGHKLPTAPGGWDSARKEWVCDACAGRTVTGEESPAPERNWRYGPVPRLRSEFEDEMASLGLGRRCRRRRT